MNQEKVNKLALTHYQPLHRQHIEHPDTQQAATRIAEEEMQKGLDPKSTLQGIRTRIHEYLQSLAPVPDPPITPTSSATEARKQLDDHHEHQTAHFQALWQLTDVIANQTMQARSPQRGVS